MKKLVLALFILSIAVPASASDHEEEAAAHKPKIGRVEAGLYGGFGFLSGSHGHYSIAEGTNIPFEGAGYAVGLRVAYFWPWRYVGFELEGDGTFATLANDDSQSLFGVRAHLIFQGEDRLAPFFLAGVGGLMVRGEPLGDDDDPSVHFGVGAKYHMGDMLSIRIEARDILSEGEEKITLKDKTAHHVQLLVGVGFSFLGE